MKYLNLGCGLRFHPDWVNVDLEPVSPEIQRVDLRERLPFPDGLFDAVYHSHVLEHFAKKQGLTFLKECCRVLRGGGVIRVAVPNLECIARIYLEALEHCTSGDPDWRERYEWIMLEMYDQTVRDSSSGEMGEYVRKASKPQLEFIRQRLGSELDRFFQNAPRAKKRSLGERVRQRALRLLMGEVALKAYEHGSFRNSGEIHKWMYDRHSLGKALLETGFIDAHVAGAAQSRIPNWTSFNLDTEPDGGVYKPDSLFMEAVRP